MTVQEQLEKVILANIEDNQTLKDLMWSKTPKMLSIGQMCSILEESGFTLQLKVKTDVKRRVTK